MIYRPAVNRRTVLSGIIMAAQNNNEMKCLLFLMFLAILRRVRRLDLMEHVVYMIIS